MRPYPWEVERRKAEERARALVSNAHLILLLSRGRKSPVPL
jgi:hypothetical protein